MVADFPPIKDPNVDLIANLPAGERHRGYQHTLQNLDLKNAPARNQH
jgi:hypothetical protein